MQFSIDRNSPVPAYYQIQLDLSDRIQRGEWNDRKQLPSESTLAEQYAVSRITLRQALAELEKDGIIKKSRGCGAKICEKPAPFVHKMDFYSIVATHEGHDGKQVTSQVLNISASTRRRRMSLSICSLNPARPWCTSSVCSSSTANRWQSGVRGCPWRVSPVWTKQA